VHAIRNRRLRESNVSSQCTEGLPCVALQFVREPPVDGVRHICGSALARISRILHLREFYRTGGHCHALGQLLSYFPVDSVLLL